jgi:hypothetical protein
MILKNALHVPHATRNLASVHHLTSDNDVFLEFHPIFSLLRTSTRGTPFFMVDVGMGSTLFLP